MSRLSDYDIKTALLWLCTWGDGCKERTLFLLGNLFLAKFRGLFLQQLNGENHGQELILILGPFSYSAAFLSSF